MNPYNIFFAVFATMAMSAAGQELLARVELTQSGTNFNYTVYNDEAAGSGRYISEWHLQLRSPARAIFTPPGWDYMTDNSTYVSFFSKDSEEPFSSDIAPGASLSGFGVSAITSASESLAFSAGTWQHGTTHSGPSVQSYILSPAILSFKANISDISYSPDGFQFTVHGLYSLRYAVEVSTNLVDWTTITTRLSPFTFREATQAGATGRFYRVDYVDAFGWFSDPAE